MQLQENNMKNAEISTLNDIKSQVAWKLLDGPEFLKPLYKIDDIGWLEPVLLIRDYPTQPDEISSSYSIYVDNTLHRAKKFLTPIARHAFWDRPNDTVLKKFNKNPKIRIVQHEMSEIEQNNAHNLLVELDKSLSEIKFLTEGLFTDAGKPVRPEINPGFNNISFRRTNINQSIEFDFGNVTNMNPELEENVRNLINYIKKLCKKPMERNYREAYKTNPFSLFEQEGTWYFRPQSILNRD